MTLTCPHCGFSREIDPSRIPERAQRVTCPRCRQSFDLRREEAAPAAESPAARKGEAEEALLTELRENLARRAMKTAEFTSAEARPKAGFWIRVVAWAVDSIILYVTQFVLTLLLGLAAGHTGLGIEGKAVLSTVYFSFGMALSWAYYVFFTGYCGQTPGKMAVRVKVVRTDGSEVGYGRAFLREVPGKFVSTILFGIGYLMIAFDSRKQGLHDKIADTFVIKLQG